MLYDIPYQSRDTGSDLRDEVPGTLVRPAYQNHKDT